MRRWGERGSAVCCSRRLRHFSSCPLYSPSPIATPRRGPDHTANDGRIRMLEKRAVSISDDTAAKRAGKSPRRRHRMLAVVLIAVLVGSVALGVTGILTRHHNEAKLRA